MTQVCSTRLNQGPSRCLPHRGTFGCPDAPEIPRYEVGERGHGLFASIMTIQQDGSLSFEGPDYVEVLSDYTIAELILHFPRGDEFIFDIVSPVSSGRCRVFMWKTRDHGLGEAADEWIRFQVDVNEQDRRMVEGAPLQPAGRQALAGLPPPPGALRNGRPDALAD